MAKDKTQDTDEAKSQAIIQPPSNSDLMAEYEALNNLLYEERLKGHDLLEKINKQSDTIAALNSSIEQRDKELSIKEEEIEALKETIDTYVENYLKGDESKPAEEIDPERAHIVASAKADIEELIAAKGRR